MEMSSGLLSFFNNSSISAKPSACVISGVPVEGISGVATIQTVFAARESADANFAALSLSGAALFVVIEASFTLARYQILSGIAVHANIGHVRRGWFVDVRQLS